MTTKPIAVTLAEATKLSGLGRTSLYKLFADGSLSRPKIWKADFGPGERAGSCFAVSTNLHFESTDEAVVRATRFPSNLAPGSQHSMHSLQSSHADASHGLGQFLANDNDLAQTHPRPVVSDDIFPDLTGLTVAQAAMAIVDQGLRVFPCHSGGTKPKAPMVNNWQSVASSDGQVAVSQWARTPGAAIGLPTGSAQKLADGMKLLVLDLDKKPDGDGWDSLREITKQIGSLPATLTVSTPSGGHHLYFKIPGDAKVTISASVLGKYIDVRCDGGYVIAPGSELIGKGRYEIVTQSQPVAEHPRAWLDRLTSRGKRQRLSSGRTARALPEISNETAHGLAVVGEVERELSNAFPGQRNDQLNASAFKLGILVAQGHLKKETAFDALIEGAMTNGLFQEDEDGAHRTIESGLEAGIEEGREESAEALTTLTEDLSLCCLPTASKASSSMTIHGPPGSNGTVPAGVKITSRVPLWPRVS